MMMMMMMMMSFTAFSYAHFNSSYQFIQCISTHIFQ